MADPQRVPSGTPTGGQFAVGERNESGVSLAVMEGTFKFPPPMRTAEDVITFWSHVEIPDEALARMMWAYRFNREAVVDGFGQHVWGWRDSWRWDAANPPVEDPVEADERLTQMMRAEEACAVEWHARMQALPESLPRADARALFRASGMMITINELGDNTDDALRERLKVAEHVMEFSDGPKPVIDAVCETGLIGHARQFVLPENYETDETGAPPPVGVPDVAMSADFDYARIQRMIDGSADMLRREINVAADDAHADAQAIAGANQEFHDTGKKKRGRGTYGR